MNKFKKVIAIITGARSDFGLVEQIIDFVIDSNDLNLQLYVTGMHLLSKYGYTITEIKKKQYSLFYLIIIASFFNLCFTKFNTANFYLPGECVEVMHCERYPKF